MSLSRPTQAAEEILGARLRPVRSAQKTATFETSQGRRLILNRQRSFIGAFLERDPSAAGLAGVQIEDKKSVGHYGPDTPRAASVMRDARLGMGCEAFYVRCDTLGALQGLVSWYERQ